MDSGRTVDVAADFSSVDDFDGGGGDDVVVPGANS